MKFIKSKIEYSKQEDNGEYKYDPTWKKDIELSGDEINPIVVYSDSDVEQFYPKQNQIIFEPLQQYDQVILHFLDDPGVTIRLGKAHIINLFMPHSLIVQITERINQQLYEMILSQIQNPDQAYKETKKKKYKENEIYAWIGMNIMMKIYQLPKLEDYWKKELYWLRGGIDACIQKGRFDFLQQNLLQHQSKNDKFMDSLRQVKKSCRNLCRPDQEIVAILVDQTYYCIDTDTQFILDYGSQDILLKFKDKNHVIYCYFPISQQLILECQQKRIYLCGYYNQELVGDWKYGEEIISDRFVQPYMVLVDRDYYQRYQELQVKLELKIDIQQHYTKNRQAFEHYLQVVLYNCQKLRGESRQQIAKGLLGEKMIFLERDRKHILIQNGQPKQSVETLTEPVTFGLRNSYENTHTPHIQSLLKEFKICPVCAKYKQLKKAYFRCEKCELLLVDPQRLKENLPPKRIFLCAYPCFEFFHRNPSQYIECIPNEELTQQGENMYFKWKQEIDIKCLNGEKSQKKKDKKKSKPTQFSSISKEAYKDQYIIEDEDLVGILNSLKKQDQPKPVEIQPILTQIPRIEQSFPSGHKKQLQSIEDRFNEERREKEKQRIEQQNREQQEYEEQILLERLERQELKKKNKKQKPQEQKQRDQKNKRKNQEPEQNYIQDFLRNHYNAKQEDE